MSMRKKSIKLIYAFLEEAIKKVGGYPLNQSLKIPDLGDTSEMKAAVQLCYRGMERENLKVSIIDYLCIVSTLYLLNITERNLKISREEIRSIDFVELMLMHYATHQEETKNFLRYFVKNPSFFLSKITSATKETEEENLKCFQIISSVWYLIMTEERKNRNAKPDAIKIKSLIDSFS